MHFNNQINEAQFASFFSTALWMADACHYWGKIDEGIHLLQAVQHIFDISDEWHIHKMDILLPYAELLTIRYFLANRESNNLFAFIENIHQQAEESWSRVNFDLETGEALYVARTFCLWGKAHYLYTWNTNGNDYSAAYKCSFQALELCEQMKAARERTLAPWIEGSPNTLDDLGPYDYALDYFSHLIDCHTSRALFFCGLVHEKQKEFSQASDLYQRSLSLALHSESQEEAASVLFQLAKIGENEELQLEYALQSLHLCEEIGLKLMLPFSHVQLGQLYLQRKDLEQAQEHCQTAVSLAEEMKLKRALMDIAFLQGEIYQHQNKREQARESFAQSYAFAEELHLVANQAAAREKIRELDK